MGSSGRSCAFEETILRTVLNEIVVQSERESPVHRLILHWAGGVHTELFVERNPSGQHRRRAERRVIDLVSELAKVCPDKATAAILNRLGYKTDKRRAGTLLGSLACVGITTLRHSRDKMAG